MPMAQFRRRSINRDIDTAIKKFKMAFPLLRDGK
jgi:hypothetical protein